MSEAKMEIKNISKHYVDNFGHNVHLIDEISFDIKKNKITTLLGPKGCGKSAILKILAGLESADNSDIIIEDSIFIPSKPSSLPWFDVEENIRFGMDSVDETKIKDIINFVGLEGYNNHQADNKSIGFRFRISLARALIREPKILLIDEPFEFVEPKYKNVLYDLLLKVIQKQNISILFGTSNITEAIYLSDHIEIMKKNPGQIISSVSINLTAEKNVDIIKSDSFLEYKSEIEKLITDSVGNKFYSYSL